MGLLSGMSGEPWDAPLKFLKKPQLKEEVSLETSTLSNYVIEVFLETSTEIAVLRYFIF